MAILTQRDRLSLLSQLATDSSRLLEWMDSLPAETRQSIYRQLMAEAHPGTPGVSLHEFLVEAWPTLEPAHPFHDSWHLRAICDHAQECIIGNSFRRLLVNVPPGMSKSIVLSIAIQCWVWTFRPWFRWLCGSYDQPTADDFSQKRRNLLLSQWYRDRWPEAANLRTTQDSKKRDTLRLIQNSAGGEMLATSPKGRALGKHPHGISLDDLHNPKVDEALSGVSLKDVRNFMEGTLSTRGAAADIDVRLMLIMQRLAEGDASAVLLEYGDCEHLCFAMEYDPDHPVRKPSLPTSLGFVDPRTIRGELLCPERFPRHVVDMLKRQLRSRAAGQLQQMPKNPEGDRFKRAWFRVISREQLPQAIFKLGRAIRYWDKAGTEGAGDWTVGVLIVHFEGKFYVADVIRGQWSAASRQARMRRAAELDSKEWSNYVIWQEQEPGSGGKESAENTVKELSGFIVRTDKVTGPKSARYNEWEEELDSTTNARTETVVLVEGDWTREFIDEHCDWRWEDKHPTDDQIDAAAGAYMKLKKQRSFVLA